MPPHRPVPPCRMLCITQCRRTMHCCQLARLGPCAAPPNAAAAAERHPALAHLPILRSISQVLAAHRILSAPVVVGNGSEAGAAAGQQVDKAPEVGAGRGYLC